MTGRQGATLNLALLAALGVILTLRTAENDEGRQLEVGKDDQLNLQPGDSLTITVARDERWEAAQARRAEQAKAAAAATDDLDHTQTADKANDAAAAEASPGTVTADTGATQTRSTGRGKA